MNTPLPATGPDLRVYQSIAANYRSDRAGAVAGPTDFTNPVNEHNQEHQEPAQKTDTAKPSFVSGKQYSTSQAAHVILGGTNTKGYWGFDFNEFTSKFQGLLCARIGNPLASPWRRDIDFSAQDYIELENAKNSLDFTRDPANFMDEALAREFAKRSDVLGISGPIGSGKDTVGEAMEPHGFIRMSFAEPLRIAGAMVYGVPLRFFNDRSLKEVPLPNSTLSPRRILQLMGTEVCREICEPLWVRRSLLRMASAMHDLPGYARNASNRLSAANGIRVILPDVRFQNEADFVRGLGGRIVRISRPSADANKAVASGAGHISESGVSQSSSDIPLVNIGSLFDFREATAKVLMATVVSPTGAGERYEDAAPVSAPVAGVRASIRRKP